MELALDRHSADGSYGRKKPPCPFSLAVVLGGALGALARYGLDGLVERRTFSVFPWSTLVINVSGCLRFGSASSSVSSAAYTTFSTFAQETVDLAKTHDYALALANAVASLTVGIAAVLAGTAVGKAIG